jgi:endoglucanase/cellulose 1,4-beta-cellobiosidase
MSNTGERALSRWLVASTIMLVAGLGLTAVGGARGSAAPPAPAAPSTTVSPAQSSPAAPGPTGSTPNPSPFPPTAPAGLVVTAVTSTSVTLSWTASTPGCCPVQGYDISMSQAFNDVIWMLPIGNVTTTTVTANVRPASQYSFRVSARDVAGHRSGSSNSVTTVTPRSDTGPDTAPPSAPANLRSTGTGPGGAALTWSPSTDNVGVTGYDVYRFDGLFVSTLLATVTTTSYTAPLTTTPSMLYVRARDAAGNVSIASNLITVTGSTVPTSSPPANPLACRVTYSVTSQWRAGFVASVTIANPGSTPIAGWALGFTFGGDQRITQAWNATYSQSGAAVTVRNADWNRTIPAGGSASVGLMGTWSAGNAAPAAFTVNGVPCAAG